MKRGNFPTLPWYLRLVLFLFIGGALYAGFWYFVTRGTRNETSEMNQQSADLRKKNAEAQLAEQRLNEFRAQYKTKQEEYEELKALLPEQRELTTVLQGVQDRARTTSISVRKFAPKDSKEDIQTANYSGKPIVVNVTSTFAGLRAFFDQMAHYQRIVSITNFDIKRSDRQGPQKTVDAQFDLIAYYASAEKLNQAGKPAPGGKPSAPAPQPAK